MAFLSGVYTCSGSFYTQTADVLRENCVCRTAGIVESWVVSVEGSPSVDTSYITVADKRSSGNTGGQLNFRCLFEIVRPYKAEYPPIKDYSELDIPERSLGKLLSRSN